MEVATLAAAPHITEPLWKIPFNGDMIARGALTAGISDALATHFIVCTDTQIHHLTIPHLSNEAPRLSVLANLDKPYPQMMAIGFEKALIHYRQNQGIRLSWGHGVDTPVCRPDLATYASLEKDGPSFSPSFVPSLDEETGCTVQEWQHQIMVVDSTLLYAN